MEISENEELDRVIPIIEEIKKKFDIFISIDSKKPKVLDHAIKAGAVIANDISMLENKEIIEIIIKHQVHYVLGHFRKNSSHKNIVPEVLSDLSKKIDILTESGFDRRKIILDPGIGFGKNLKHNLMILKKISVFHSLGFPVLIGVSRKRFIGQISGPYDTKERLGGTLSSILFSLSQGVRIFRVHNVEEVKQGILVYEILANR